MSPKRPGTSHDIASLAGHRATEVLRTHVDRMNELQSTVDRLSGAGILESVSAVGRMTENISRTSAVLSAAMGQSHINALNFPDIASLYRLPEINFPVSPINLPEFDFEVPEAIELGRAAQAMIEATRISLDHFRVPEYTALSGLATNVYRSLNPSFFSNSDAIAASLASLTQPWARITEEIASATSLARIQGFGNMLGHVPPFDQDFTALVRESLGDWRDPVAIPDGILEHSIRSEFYVEQGFDDNLVDVPDGAFFENLELAGFVFAEIDNNIDGYDDEEAERRTTQLHAVLQRFEIALRRFIAAVMTAQFGEDWPRRRLPNDLYDQWLTKQAKDQHGSAWEPIDYADFRDYELIICKADNWKEAFAPHFRTKESVRESLQRLYPARLSTMHARPLGKDDALFAAIEVRRMFQVISVVTKW